MTCTKNGQHTLPEGEQSWNDRDADAIVAAALDGCEECVTAITNRITTAMTSPFGMLFTTWVLQTIDIHMQLGGQLPATADQMFRPETGISGPSRRALAGVKLPTVESMGPVGSVVQLNQLDASEAARWLSRAYAADRRAVLDDALDGIVGKITAQAMLGES